MACLDRQQLLQVLYQLFPKKPDIYVGKSVVGVDEQDSRVLVYTADGSTYEGDLVVGADGVHSRVRTQMWRAAKMRRPGLVSESEMKGTDSYPDQIGDSDGLTVIMADRDEYRVCLHFRCLSYGSRIGRATPAFQSRQWNSIHPRPRSQWTIVLVHHCPIGQKISIR